MKFDNHRMITILASVLLVIAFFMPWISVGALFSVSAWDILTGRFENTPPWGAYVLLLVPIAAALLLFQKLMSKPAWRLLYFVPLLAIVGLFTYTYIEYERTRTDADRMDIDFSFNQDFVSTILEVVGIGFWLTIMLSIFLFILGCVRVRRVNRLDTPGERSVFSDEGQPLTDDR
jgi:amino acid permease